MMFRVSLWGARKLNTVVNAVSGVVLFPFFFSFALSLGILIEMMMCCECSLARNKFVQEILVHVGKIVRLFQGRADARR